MAAEPEDRRRRLARSNFGLPTAEVLAGNVGYLDIRQFVDPTLGGDAVAAAMAFLGNVLKHLDRATVVGEATAGGANPGAFHRLNHRFVMFVAEGRVTSAATGSNWEEVGVSPDVEIDPLRARDMAHLLVLETLSDAGDAEDPDLAALIRELRSRLP